MARTKKCVKDADTGKCRKGIKSGRPRCSGKKADCVEDDLNGRCRKSRKPGRPPVNSAVKRRYKKQSRKTRSDAGKPRTIKCRKPRSDRGKSRCKRTGELLSINDYEEYLKVASNKNLLRDLLNETSEMVANDESLNKFEQPKPSAPPLPDKENAIDEAVNLLMFPSNGGMRKKNTVVETDTSEYDEPIYNPKFGEYGAWYQDSVGNKEWMSEAGLPQSMKEKVGTLKAGENLTDFFLGLG
jgi:hypothetical protein